LRNSATTNNTSSSNNSKNPNDKSVLSKRKQVRSSSNNNNNNVIINNSQSHHHHHHTGVIVVPNNESTTTTTISNNTLTTTQPQSSSISSLENINSTTPSSSSSLENNHKSSPPAHLSGDQNTAAAGLITMLIVYAMCYQRWTSHRQLASEFEAKRLAGVPVGPYSGVGGVWSPFQDYEWWIAAIGGLLLFWHYQTLYTAYDTAPSTVINPLLQVSSTWVLLGTAIPSVFTGEPFIQPFDLFCYVIIVVGGLLPSIEGDMWAMLKPAFWKQSFVKNAVLSEISLGLYDLLLSHVLKVGRLQMSDDSLIGEELSYIHSTAGPNLLENEFFFIAWCWFCVTFAFAYGLHPQLQNEYFALRSVPIRLVLLAALGQVFMFVGYYCSQFAYSWYYSASVVHAVEASMAQTLNLILSAIAKRCFNLGRDSAVSGMKFKLISVVVVSIGLFLIAFKDVGNPGGGGGGGHGR
jgi:hypothetical protein